MGRILIQIEDGEPFEPDVILRELGNHYGTTDVTHADDLIKSEIPTSCVAIADYIQNKRRYTNYYRSCQWISGKNGDSIARYVGLLAVFDDKSALSRERYGEAMDHVQYGHAPAGILESR